MLPLLADEQCNRMAYKLAGTDAVVFAHMDMIYMDRLREMTDCAHAQNICIN